MSLPEVLEPGSLYPLSLPLCSSLCEPLSPPPLSLELLEPLMPPSLLDSSPVELVSLLEPLEPLSFSTISSLELLSRLSLSAIVSSYKVGILSARPRAQPHDGQNRCQQLSMFTVDRFSL